MVSCKCSHSSTPKKGLPHSECRFRFIPEWDPVTMLKNTRRHPWLLGPFWTRSSTFWSPKMEFPLGPANLSGWWFGTWLLSSPIDWDDDPIWGSYFSGGVKPPTSYDVHLENCRPLDDGILHFQTNPCQPPIGTLIMVEWLLDKINQNNE